MLIWNVNLKGRVLVTVTERATAEGLVALLNNGTLHGVEGDPAAYEAARGMRAPAPFTLATVEKVVEEEPTQPRTRRRPQVVSSDGGNE